MSTPQNASFGESVVISCEAIGVPLPSYIIIHNNTDIVSKKKTYIIIALKYSHAGSYKCIATNKLGSSSKIFDVTVFAIGILTYIFHANMNFQLNKRQIQLDKCVI